MTAGLAGFGIGGIFYLCLVLVMPLRELYYTAKGKTSVERWKKVGFQWSLAALMVLAMQIEFLVVRAGIRGIVASDTAFGEWLGSKLSTQPVLPQVLWGLGIAIGLILVLCVMTYIARIAQKAGRIRQTVG
jgi:uncharacterized membrane protein (DUF485 family)